MSKKQKENKNSQELLKQLEEKNEKLKQENEELKKELEKIKEVAANTQAQYVSLKNDFDNYILRVEKQKQEDKEKIFIEVIKGFVPIIEEIRRSVENIPDDIKDHRWVKGVQIVYENIKKYLESKNVFIEDSVGCDIDFEKHEPISTQEVEKDKKGKIIQEHSKVYIYKKDNKQIVICPAKVVVGK